MEPELSHNHPAVSIVLPAWNEAKNLPGCLDALASTFGGSSHEVVLVDDGSRDQTGAVARRWADEHPGVLRIETHESNKGFGAAMRTGIAAASGEYVVTCPADFRFEAEDWAPFAAALGRADVIVGRRRRREGYNPLMKFNAWLYPHIVSSLFGLRLRDVNWICVYRRSLLERITITQKGIPMLTEVLVKLRDLGATFVEVDCRMQPRTIGTPSAARPRVMWRTLTGLLGFWWTYRREPGRSADPSTSSSVHFRSGSSGAMW